MTEYRWKRGLMYVACCLSLNACDAYLAQASEVEKSNVPGLTRDEIQAGGGEQSYVTIVAVQEEHLETE